MVYNKAWFNDMTMVLLHNHGSMTVQNLTNHSDLIKLINVYYLKFNLKRMIYVYTQFSYPIDDVNVLKYKCYRKKLSMSEQIQTKCLK